MPLPNPQGQWGNRISLEAIHQFSGPCQVRKGHDHRRGCESCGSSLSQLALPTNIGRVMGVRTVAESVESEAVLAQPCSGRDRFCAGDSHRATSTDSGAHETAAPPAAAVRPAALELSRAASGGR